MALGGLSDRTSRRLPPRQLPPVPSSVGEARRLVRHELRDAQRDDLTEAAELLVSEMVTNAVVHAGTAVELAMSVADDGLLVEVGDGSPHLPSRSYFAPTAATGRGMMLLEQLADDWGISPQPNGKKVWFHLSSGGDNGRDGAATQPELGVTGARPGATVMVQLLNVPLLLHAAWHQHAQALLREHLLVTMDEDTERAIQVHAQAHDALALLAEHIPLPGISDVPDQLIADAVDNAIVVAEQVTVPVPLESVPNFAVLDDALDAAAALADAGDFLTTPTQPELRTLRRWLCQQVEQQGSGGLATPLPPEDEAVAPSAVTELAWDSSAVERSQQALIAADDTNQIMAVSRAALELLGYDEPADLVGERIVAIIPPRYRQAHLAGFTLHFLSGRDVLLNTTVTVPALRRDGTETAIKLTITSEAVRGGRKVFIACLDPAG